MARRTKAESEATAVAVLEAALDLFARRGFAAVRLDDVAAAAGVTRGAVYHHYADKAGLFAAVAGLAHGRVGDAVADAAAGVSDPRAAFRAGCRAFLDASIDDAHRRVMLIDAPAVLGWGAWRREDAGHAGRHLDEALASLRDLGLLSVPSIEATGALLSGAMNEAALWVAGHEEASRPRALREAADSLDVLLDSVCPR